MSERLAILHGVRVGIEEIIGSGNRLVADWGIEMTDLYVQSAPQRDVSFEVRLRKGKTIVPRRSTAQIQIPVTSAERLTGIHIERRNTMSSTAATSGIAIVSNKRTIIGDSCQTESMIFDR